MLVHKVRKLPHGGDTHGVRAHQAKLHQIPATFWKEPWGPRWRFTVRHFHLCDLLFRVNTKQPVTATYPEPENEEI